MDFETAMNVVRSRFQTEVVNLEANGLPTHYDNDGTFEKPQDGARFVRFNILLVGTFQVETGASNRYRTTGLAVVQVFLPIGKGDKKNWILVDKIVAAFRGAEDTGVQFKTPSPLPVGRDGGYYQVNVELPFYFDDFS